MTDSVPPPPPPVSPYGSPPPNDPVGPGSTSFFGALFDFTFTRFVTPLIVKVAYVIAVVLVGLFYLIFLVSAFTQSAALGLVVLIAGAVAALLYIVLIRMTLEFYLAVVRMSEDIHNRPLR